MHATVIFQTLIYRKRSLVGSFLHRKPASKDYTVTTPSCNIKNAGQLLIFHGIRMTAGRGFLCGLVQRPHQAHGVEPRSCAPLARADAGTKASAIGKAW